MYIKEAHILIEQGLQNIGVFAYSDMHPDELDLAIHTEIWNILEKDFPSLQGEPQKPSKTQANLDKYKNLIVKEYGVTVTLVDDLYVGELPENYYHLIKDRSIVLYECATCRVTSGNIVADEWYIVKDRTVVYNNIAYTAGKIFKGITGVTTFASTIDNNALLVWKLKRKSVPNRLTEEEHIDTTNANALAKTNRTSPLSVVTGQQIAVYVDDFFIEKVYISYFHKPNIPYLSFTKYTSVNTLSNNKTYEVISGSIIYRGLVYSAKPQYQFDSFTTSSGFLTFTGTGIVRVKEEGDIDLPRQIALKVVENTILRLSAITEQNQQKIVNLSQLSK